MAASVAKRLRQALEEELPGVELNDDQLEYMADSWESEEDVAQAWWPFIMSFGADAASDEEGAQQVSQRVLRRLKSDNGLNNAAPSHSPQPPPAPKGVTGLTEWLERLRLMPYAEQARAWCEHHGHADIDAVIREREAFVEALQMKPLERRRVMRDAEDVQRRAVQQLAGEPAAATSSRDPGKAAAAEDGLEGLPTFGPTENPSQYVILDKVGSGANATVHRCRSRLKPGEVLAVKIIQLVRLQLQDDPRKVMEKLHRETSILLSLDHPHVVALYDVVETKEELYLVMELVEGGDLFEHIVKRAPKALEEREARSIFLQLVHTLQYIHAKGIVHRDLKPENILVDRKASRSALPEVKISDFGHSKLIDGESTALTRVGTPQYWAPEVSDARTCARGYDERVDLWSLGVVLYVMLEGTYPFEGEYKIDQTKEVKVEFKDGSKTSEQAKDLIRALIRVKPQDRLSLERCLQHRWVVQDQQVMNSARPSGQEASDEHFGFQADLAEGVKQSLKDDLRNFTHKFKFAAVLRSSKSSKREVVVTWGKASATPGSEQAVAREELLRILQRYGWKPSPGGGYAGASMGAPLAPVREASAEFAKPTR